MIYLLNTHLNAKKKVAQALTKIYGLGTFQCSQICDELGISSQIRLNQLTDTEIDLLNNFILQNYDIGIERKRTQLQNIHRLIKIGTYRGFRHIDGLPVRGQKTHGNSQTVRKLKKSFHLSKN